MQRIFNYIFSKLTRLTKLIENTQLKSVIFEVQECRCEESYFNDIYFYEEFNSQFQIQIKIKDCFWSIFFFMNLNLKVS